VSTNVSLVGGSGGAGVGHRRTVRGNSDATEVPAADMRVDLVASRGGVTEEFLDVPEVGSGLREMGGEGVPKGMGSHALADTGSDPGVSVLATRSTAHVTTSSPGPKNLTLSSLGIRKLDVVKSFASLNRAQPPPQRCMVFTG